jgi:single-strand DNA-binding protein
MAQPAPDTIEDVPTVNLVVLRGVASGPPEVRTLTSGMRVATLSVRVHALDPGATSVPVSVREPAAWVEDLDEGDPVVVVGALRRRFFRTAAGATGARVEVEARVVGKGTDRRRLESARRRAQSELDALE